MGYSNQRIRTKTLTHARAAFTRFDRLIERNPSVNKGIIIYLLQEAIKPGGWKAFYPKLVKLKAKLVANGHNTNNLTNGLKQLHDIYHKNPRRNSDDANHTVPNNNAHHRWFRHNNVIINVTDQDVPLIQQDLKQEIDTYINRLKNGENNPQTITQQIDTYKQDTENIEVNDTWQNSNDVPNRLGFTDEQKAWLHRNNKIHNLLYHSNDAIFKPIKNAITAGFIKQGTVNHLFSQIIAENMNYEKFYGEHLNKLYTHLLNNSMGDVAACKVIVAFKHIFDIYHNEKCQHNNVIQTAWQRHFPGLNIVNDQIEEFKKQIKTFIKNEIDNNNNEQIKKQQENYAKNYKNITSNSRWQHYSPENKRFTKEQSNKLSSQTLYIKHLPISSIRLLAIAIVNKHNELAGHPPINPSYNELTELNQTKVNSLMRFLKSYIPLQDGKPNLEVLNHAIMHAPRLDIQTAHQRQANNTLRFTDIHSIDPEYFNIKVFRKIRFETDKNSKNFKKDFKIIENALLPAKVQQNIRQLITDFINQTYIRNVQEVPHILSMLRAIINPNAGHVIVKSDGNNISTVYTNILDFMRNFKPDNLTREEFNATCIHAIKNYIKQHLSDPKKYQLFFNEQQKRHEEIKRKRISKNYLKETQDLANKANSELTGEGYFTPKQYEQNLKDLIQEGSIISYTSTEIKNKTKNITKHIHKIILPDFDDSNYPIVMESTATTDKRGTTHIQATLPDLNLESERASYLLLSYLRTLKKTGLEEVNISKLDYTLQARVAACCGKLNLKTDIKPKNKKLYQKFSNKLNVNDNPTQHQPQKSGLKSKLPEMNKLQQMTPPQSETQSETQGVRHPPANPY